MILICSSCASRYFAADESIGEGRMVKCAACGHEWIATPSLKLDQSLDDPPAPGGGVRLIKGLLQRLRSAPLPAIERSPAAMIRARQAQRERRMRLIQASSAWGGALAFLAGIFAAGAIARDPLARIWPQSASLFTAAGLEVNIYGLIIEDVETTRTQTPQGEAIHVRGIVRNLRADAQATPPIRILWRDGKGQLLNDSLGHPEKAALGGGQLTRFEGMVSGPGANAAFVEVRFGLRQGEHLASKDPVRGEAKRKIVASLGP